EAWRSLAINARRFIDFLMVEHMEHAGARNGYLLAPRRQLEQAGIGAQYVSAAIEETERVRLVAVKRGVGKRPSTYTLTWLPLGTPPERPKRSTSPVLTYKRKSLDMTYEGKPLDAYKGKSQAPSDLQSEGTSPIPSTYKGKHPSRSSYQDRSYITDVHGPKPQTQASDGAPSTKLNG